MLQLLLNSYQIFAMLHTIANIALEHHQWLHGNVVMVKFGYRFI
jgi:hypothetical protein